MPEDLVLELRSRVVIERLLWERRRRSCEVMEGGVYVLSEKAALTLASFEGTAGNFESELEATRENQKGKCEGLCLFVNGQGSRKGNRPVKPD